MARNSRLDRSFELPRRSYTIMSREDSENGKASNWTEMEIRGPIKNLSPDLWDFTHLTSLYLNDNNLQVSLCSYSWYSTLWVDRNLFM